MPSSGANTNSPERPSFSGTVADWLGIRRSTYLSMVAQGVLRLGLVIVGLTPPRCPTEACWPRCCCS